MKTVNLLPAWYLKQGRRQRSLRVHAVAMVLAGGLIAWLVYRYLGLRFVSRSWFNLDAVWALSFILVGTVALLLNAGDVPLS